MSDMVKALWVRWSEHLEAEPTRGPFMLTCVVCTLIAVGYALHACTRGTTQQRLVRIAPGAFLTLVSMGILCVLISDAREAHLRVLLAGQQFGHRYLYPQLEWLRLLAPIVVIALPAMLFAVGRAIRLRALMWSAPLVGVSALSILAGDPDFLRWSFCLNFERITSEVLARGKWLDTLGMAMVVLGACLAVALARPLRVARPTPTAVLVFACGAAAFGWTRDHAADRHHSFSMASKPAAGIFPFRPKWVTTCTEVDTSPLVSFERELVYVDRYLVSSPSAMSYELVRVKRNWSITQPGRPFPGRVRVGVAPNRSLAELQPWLDAMFAAGYANVVVVFDDSNNALTHTLGYVSVRDYCGVELLLTPCATEEYDTLEDALRAARDDAPTIAVPFAADTMYCCG